MRSEEEIKERLKWHKAHLKEEEKTVIQEWAPILRMLVYELEWVLGKE